MKLTAVFEPSPEGGYNCFVEEIPAAISQGETLDQAKEIFSTRFGWLWMLANLLNSAFPLTHYARVSNWPRCEAHRS